MPRCLNLRNARFTNLRQVLSQVKFCFEYINGNYLAWWPGSRKTVLRRSCVTIKMVQQGMTTSLSDYDTRTRRRAACEKFWKPYQPTNRFTSVGLHFTGLTLDQVGRNSSFAVSLSRVMIVTFTMMNINITSGVTVIIALYHYCCYF